MKVDILDVMGQNVITKNYGNQIGKFDQSINVSSLSEGIYIMQVLINASVMQIKIVKK
jgi:glutamine amidotransferase PdxT